MRLNRRVSEPISIDIWSDIACPWCYIGKRNLEAGLAATAGDDDAPQVNITFHSFELSPDTPVDFEGDEADFLMGHKGMPRAQVEQMLDRVTGIAKDAGLDYRFDLLQHTNTVKAHELLHHAKAEGRQHDMEERLMSAYFTEGRHVGRIEDLADLAAEIGLDRDAALEALRSERHLDDVRADQAQAQAYGIQGVPFFVIDGQYGVSGAQPPEAFAGVLRELWAKRGEDAEVLEG
ncbi:Predicted dithiol-disulfide isomerase, DsbA family [Microbacterium azadirachtae]|jgi:predicted DsbA family dithiol-disulfide isomerase|uniref:Predicted dithiol-disulfide isomerase, DsbA family n=1 Tax=Microbacterium azadirachtae TaxID=582680 RepID=A0A1I6FU36_9MICO|nr:Predicted dithiol-disulfide isomerase, DsbA family [Microbacterium azadirachtae]